MSKKEHIEQSRTSTCEKCNAPSPTSVYGRRLCDIHEADGLRDIVLTELKGGLDNKGRPKDFKWLNCFACLVATKSAWEEYSLTKSK